MTHVPINELTFGIELEVIMPAESNGEGGRDALAAALEAAGIPARHEALSHTGRPWWKVTTDSTIGYSNAEVVSPSRGDHLLSGERGFEDVRTVVRVLTEFGVRVNRSCGFHVHVGARDRFSEQIGFFKELAKTYAKFESVLDTIMARSRRGDSSQWCRRFVYDERIEQATTIDRIISIYGGGDRHYTKLNLAAFNRHGTVEFRQHQGTTNAQKIESWVKLCLRMVAHAARNTERTGAHREFVPRPPPLLPPTPHFPATRDLTRASHLRRADLPRFAVANSYDLRDMVLIHVAANSHRPGTDAHQQLEACRHPDQTLWNLWRVYHVSRSWLGYFADRGEVVVVRRSQAPDQAPSEEERRRREATTAAHQAEVEGLQREHAEAVVAARAAWVAARGTQPPTERPPTDAAPTTLDGLMELISAPEPERAYFTERQMELS